MEEDGFDDSLDSVRDRVDEIESLHRTRELTVRLFSFVFLPLSLRLLLSIPAVPLMSILGLG